MASVRCTSKLSPGLSMVIDVVRKCSDSVLGGPHAVRQKTSTTVCREQIENSLFFGGRGTVEVVPVARGLG